MTHGRWTRAMAVLGLVVAGVWGTLAAPWGAVRADAPTNAPAPSVVVRRVASKTIRRSVRLPADVLAYVDARSAPRLAGRVGQVRVDFGARVGANDVLAVIEAPELDAAVDVAQARVAAAEALQRARAANFAAGDGAAAEARAARGQAEAEVARRSAELDAARAEAVVRAAVRARLEAALAASPNLVSRDSVDEARGRDAAAAGSVAIAIRRLDEARAAVETATARIDAVAARTAALGAEEKAAGADADVARAAVAELEARRAFRSVRSPCAGVVVERNAEVGDLVQAGGPALFRVVDQSRVRVRFRVAETDVRACEPGRRVRLTVDGVPGAAWDATVTRTVESLDLRTRSMLAEAELENGDGRLRHGQFGRVTLDLEEHRDALVVPAEAVTTVKRKSSLLLVVDGRVVKRAVTTGADDGREVVVTQGVAAGDRVIVRGGASVAAGDVVVAVEESSR